MTLPHDERVGEPGIDAPGEPMMDVRAIIRRFDAPDEVRTSSADGSRWFASEARRSDAPRISRDGGGRRMSVRLWVSAAVPWSTWASCCPASPPRRSRTAASVSSVRVTCSTSDPSHTTAGSSATSRTCRSTSSVQTRTRRLRADPGVLDVPAMNLSPPEEQARFFRPAALPGVETLHATFLRHRYTAHVHDSWVIACVDCGAASVHSTAKSACRRPPIDGHSVSRPPRSSCAAANRSATSH